MTALPAIIVRQLTKSYGSVEALRGLDLEVQPGEIFGFLGPNGAGKTTTIRCLLDLIRPDAGTARVLGFDPQADPVAVRARVGYLPGELRLEDHLTGRRVLKMAPLHHHFELAGWPEPRVVLRFWLFAAVGALLGIAFVLTE